MSRFVLPRAFIAVVRMQPALGTGFVFSIPLLHAAPGTTATLQDALAHVVHRFLRASEASFPLPVQQRAHGSAVAGYGGVVSKTRVQIVVLRNYHTSSYCQLCYYDLRSRLGAVVATCLVNTSNNGSLHLHDEFSQAYSTGAEAVRRSPHNRRSISGTS